MYKSCHRLCTFVFNFTHISLNWLCQSWWLVFLKFHLHKDPTKLFPPPDLHRSNTCISKTSSRFVWCVSWWIGHHQVMPTCDRPSGLTPAPYQRFTLHVFPEWRALEFHLSDHPCPRCHLSLPLVTSTPPGQKFKQALTINVISFTGASLLFYVNGRNWVKNSNIWGSKNLSSYPKMIFSHACHVYDRCHAI